MAKNTSPAHRHKCMVQRFHLDYTLIALIFHSSKRTKVVLQSAPGKLYNDPLITVNGQILIYSIKSSTREAVSPEQCALMTRTAKPVWHLEEMCKCISEMKQRLIPS